MKRLLTFLAVMFGATALIAAPQHSGWTATTNAAAARVALGVPSYLEVSNIVHLLSATNRILYVDTRFGTTNGQPGDAKRPFNSVYDVWEMTNNTIRGAFTRAVAGDCVYILPGVHRLALIPPMDNVTVIIDPGATVIQCNFSNMTMAGAAPSGSPDYRLTTYTLWGPFIQAGHNSRVYNFGSVVVATNAAANAVFGWYDSVPATNLVVVFPASTNVYRGFTPSAKTNWSYYPGNTFGGYDNMVFAQTSTVPSWGTIYGGGGHNGSGYDTILADGAVTLIANNLSIFSTNTYSAPGFVRGAYVKNGAHIAFNYGIIGAGGGTNENASVLIDAASVQFNNTALYITSAGSHVITTNGGTAVGSVLTNGALCAMVGNVPIPITSGIEQNYFTTTATPFDVVPGVSVYVPYGYFTNVTTTNFSAIYANFVNAQINYLTALGTVTASNFVGSGTGLTNLNLVAGRTTISGSVDQNFLYNSNGVLSSVPINTWNGVGFQVPNSVGNSSNLIVSFAGYEDLLNGTSALTQWDTNQAARHLGLTNRVNALITAGGGGASSGTAYTTNGVVMPFDPTKTYLVGIGDSILSGIGSGDTTNEQNFISYMTNMAQWHGLKACYKYGPGGGTEEDGTNYFATTVLSNLPTTLSNGTNVIVIDQSGYNNFVTSGEPGVTNWVTLASAKLSFANYLQTVIPGAKLYVPTLMGGAIAALSSNLVFFNEWVIRNSNNVFAGVPDFARNLPDNWNTNFADGELYGGRSTYDGVHPSFQGHRALARELDEVIRLRKSPQPTVPGWVYASGSGAKSLGENANTIKAYHPVNGLTTAVFSPEFGMWAWIRAGVSQNIAAVYGTETGVGGTFGNQYGSAQPALVARGSAADAASQILFRVEDWTKTALFTVKNSGAVNSGGTWLHAGTLECYSGTGGQQGLLRLDNINAPFIWYFNVPNNNQLNLSLGNTPLKFAFETNGNFIVSGAGFLTNGVTAMGPSSFGTATTTNLTTPVIFGNPQLVIRSSQYSNTVAIFVNSNNLVSIGNTPGYDPTVALDVAGAIVATSTIQGNAGFISTANEGPISINANGRTNTLGKMATAYVTAVATAFTIQDSGANTLYTSPVLSATISVTLQPNWSVNAASGLTGTIIAW